MLKKIIGVIAGLIVAFLLMMLFEYLNSLIFPFPAGMDLNNLAAVRAYSQTLPWTAYLMVIAGWVIASFFGGFVPGKYIPASDIVAPLIIGILLTAGSVGNFIMLEHPIWVMVIGVLVFIPMTVAGYKAAKS